MSPLYLAFKKLKTTCVVCCLLRVSLDLQVNGSVRILIKCFNPSFSSSFKYWDNL